MGKINYYIEGRVFEWCMAVSMFVCGLEILTWSKLGAFQWLVEFVPYKIVGGGMVLIGWTRIGGLMLNGHSVGEVVLGPWIRAVCSVLSAFVWVQFAFALLQFSLKNGYPSIGLMFWVSFVIGELYVAYTTVKNA